MKKSRISIEKENDKTILTINPLSFLKKYKRYMQWNNFVNIFLIILAVPLYIYYGMEWELTSSGEYKLLEINYFIALICFGPVFIIWVFGFIRVIADKKGYGHKMIMILDAEKANIKYKTHEGSHKLSNLTIKTLKEKPKDNSAMTLEILIDKTLLYKNIKLPKSDRVKLKEFAKTNKINYEEGNVYGLRLTGSQSGNRG